jgi:hypothetical protein
LLDRQPPGQEYAFVRRHLAPELGIVPVGFGIRRESTNRDGLGRAK